MPGMGATDPADLMAQARREAGLTRQLQQSGVFRLILREGESGAFRNGTEMSSYKDIKIMNKLMSPPRPSPAGTDNEICTQLVGIDMMNMVTFLIAYPDASLDEIAVFIYNEGGELYDNSTISRRLKELQITKKKASTEAYQAFTPENRFKAHSFSITLLPLG